MPLTKTPVSISFAKGLNTKTDPFRLPIGDFLSLQNTVFTIEGLLQKRNGYGLLSPLPDTSYSFACTFNGNLMAIGSNLAAYSAGSNTWVQKGSIVPVELDTTTLIRNNTNQSTCDAVVYNDTLVCTVYTDQDPTNLANKIYRYAVADSNTGQNLVAPTTITANSAPKVFLLGNRFVIVYGNSTSLLFIAISTSTLAADSPVTISSTFTSNGAFDAYMANNSLYVAWAYNVTPAIKVNRIDSTLSVHSAVTFASHNATAISVTADQSGATPVVYVSFYYGGDSTGYTLAVDQNLLTLLAPTQIISSTQVINITSVASQGICTFFYQVLNTYSYSAPTRSDYIVKNTITYGGTVGSSATMLRSVGLASKAFVMGSKTYMLSVYGAATTASPSFQPTYFLIDSSGNICLKLAYSNGGGYLGALLPNATVSASTVYFPYLFKDLIVPVNKSRLAPQVDATYSQTGINLAAATFTAKVLNTAEIGSDLHLTGGFLWMYDGYTPVEHNFHLWPEDLGISGAAATGQMAVQEYFYCATYEWSDNQGNLFRSAPSIQIPYTILTAPSPITGNRTSGSPTIASVSAFTSLQVGQQITGTGIPANTFITAINSGGSTLTMSNNATSGSATSTTLTIGAVSAVTVNVPTLRLTYKIANPVKIVLYRWSTAQQTFYQVTSVSTPVLNDPTVDSIPITDTSIDGDILGNSILYTTGGVVENIGAPPTASVTIFKSRLFLIDAEDKNLLWFSKQVIEATPVEMSDLFTIYVPPTVGAQGSTGPMRCLAAMDDKLIIFKDDAIYYITGTGPDNTGANNDFSDPIFITSTVGCANQNSIAFIPDGLMFQSDKGIWLLGRDLSTKYIGAPVEAFTDNNEVESALAIPGTNQVRFTLSNGVTLMFDYFYGQWGTFVGVPAVSSTLFQGLHTFINKFGAVYKETPGAYLDGSVPVLISFLTGWINLGGLQGYQRAYLFYLLGSYLSPHKLLVQVAYDYNPSPLQTTIISPDNYSGNYGTVPGTYGQQSPYGGSPVLEQWKVDLATQECQSFQISVTETFDAFFQTIPGAGLTLSGLDLLVGVKRGFKPIRAANTVG